MAKKKYYAVAAGKQPGIYTQWFGKDGAQTQVAGFPGARYKGFATRKEAEAFLADPPAWPKRGQKKSGRSKQGTAARTPLVVDEDRRVIYTDGSSLGNPGPGGYGVVIAGNEGDRELAAGFRKTTNNRMELLACIVGLEQVDPPEKIVLFSDSRYVVDGITKGWAKNWRRRGWRKSNGEPALNPDLWERLLVQCERHDVIFQWVKGHAGHEGNERCDRLAVAAAGQENLPPDMGYEG